MRTRTLALADDSAERTPLPAKTSARSRPTVTRTTLLLTAVLCALLLFFSRAPPQPSIVIRGSLGTTAAAASTVPQPPQLEALVRATQEVSSPPPPPAAISTASAAVASASARVALLVLVVGSSFPPWWPFLIMSYARNHPTYELIVVHTGAPPTPQQTSGNHVRYEHVPLAALQQRFIDKLGATRAQVEAKFASGKGLSDLKPLYGRIFDDLLSETRYTHWGWVDWDILVGDLLSVVPTWMLWQYDALTFPGATLGFAWAGQFSILRNTREARTLYEVVPNFLALSFKTGAGEQRQSGWEERIFLREVLHAKPTFTLLFHMAAQYDYKAQWLTWVPFDHFWDRGAVLRCARLPLARKGRPPYLVENGTAYGTNEWLRDVAQIQADPYGFEQRKVPTRVCIRWDLESSPWRCCPHSSGVGYVARGKQLTPMLLPYKNSSAETRVRLSAAANRAAAVRPREPSGYDVCQEGAFFHAGLQPKGGIGGSRAPGCQQSTWALQDDIGRFSGSLSLLEEQCG